MSQSEIPSGDLIVRRVKVDRTRTFQQVLDATGRKQDFRDDVVDPMPRLGEEGVEEVEGGFFTLDLSSRGGQISDDDLANEFDLRGLKPDPYYVAAVNEADQAFADTHPNGTHWRNAKGERCYFSFHRQDTGLPCGVRMVRIARYEGGHRGDGWFGGSRK